MIKRLSVLATILLIPATFTGCAARISAQIDQKMASWQGRNINDLIATYGPPDQVLDDGSGGKIMVWTMNRSYAAPGSSTTHTTGSATASGSTISGSTTSNTIYNPGQTYQWKVYRMFWVNKDSIIYKWSWRGL